MAGEKTLGQFAFEMAFLAADMPRMTAEATGAAALMVTRSLRASIRADSGGDSRLSGARARVGARYDVKGVTNPTALIKATGPVHWLESGTGPHAIRARRRSFLRTPYGPRLRVLHPGMRGKQTWSRGLADALPRVPEVYAKGLHDAVRKAIS